MKQVISLAIAGIFASFIGMTHADTIKLKNGDHITGKVVSAAGGKVVIAPDFASGTNITIPMNKIATFSSKKPITLKLEDGTVVKQALNTSAEAGNVETASGGSLVPQKIALKMVKQINPPPVAWHGTIGVNGMVAQSIDKTMTLGISANGVRRSEKDRIRLGAAYNFGRQEADGVKNTTANNWNANASYDYFITKKWYSYIGAQLGGNKINNLDLRFLPSAGMGYQWFDEPDFHLSTEAGVSWLYQDYSTDPEPTKEWGLRFAYHVDKSLHEGRIFLFHNLAYLPSVEDTSNFIVQTDAGIRVNLTKSMFTDLKANLVYDNNPASGAKKNASQVLLGVGYNY